jgi:hypothetical protein
MHSALHPSLVDLERTKNQDMDLEREEPVRSAIVFNIDK